MNTKSARTIPAIGVGMLFSLCGCTALAPVFHTKQRQYERRLKSAALGGLPKVG